MCLSAAFYREFIMPDVVTLKNGEKKVVVEVGSKTEQEYRAQGFSDKAQERPKAKRGPKPKTAVSEE